MECSFQEADAGLSVLWWCRNLNPFCSIKKKMECQFKQNDLLSCKWVNWSSLIRWWLLTTRCKIGFDMKFESNAVIEPEERKKWKANKGKYFEATAHYQLSKIIRQAQLSEDDTKTTSTWQWRAFQISKRGTQPGPVVKFDSITYWACFWSFLLFVSISIRSKHWHTGTQTQEHN
jgi:hypothetical protein